MALSRPVATLVWNGATDTGISGAGGTDTGIGGIAHFGIPVTRIAMISSNASTEAVTGTIEGTLGYSTGWVVLHTLTTGGTTGSVNTFSTADFVVDKARLNVSANASTGVFQAWIAGA